MEIQRTCGLALFWVEITIARGEREAGFFSYCRTNDDFSMNIQVSDELFDDGTLLEIFASEIRLCGGDDVKELGDDGGDTFEVAGAVVPFKGEGRAARDDGGGEAFGVDDFGGWSQDAVGTAGLAQFEVGVEGPGIAAEIFVGAKLGGVDEDGDGDGFALGAGLADEGSVAFVEGAHGGDEAHGGVAGAPGADAGD